MAILSFETDRKVAEENDVAEGAASAREAYTWSHALPLERSVEGQGKGLALYRCLLTTPRCIYKEVSSAARVQHFSKVMGVFLGHHTLTVIDRERTGLYPLKDARFLSSDQIILQCLCRASQRYPQLSVQPGVSSVRSCHCCIPRPPYPAPRRQTPLFPTAFLLCGGGLPRNNS